MAMEVRCNGSRQRSFRTARRRRRLGLHRDVDVFENHARSDAAKPVRRFDQVIAGQTAMLAAERVGEKKRFRKLTSSHEEASTVCGPRTICVHILSPFGGGLPTSVTGFSFLFQSASGSLVVTSSSRYVKKCEQEIAAVTGRASLHFCVAK